MTWRDWKVPSLALAATLSLAALAAAAPADSSFTLEPEGAQQLYPGYYPIQVPLKSGKPAAVKQEPAYRAAPRYGTIRLGNGPKSEYVIAVDEPADADWRIYLDLNRNGDLTDDGDGAWKEKRQAGARTIYGTNNYVARASWGTPQEESASGPYGLSFYRFVGQDYVLMYRRAARTGTVTVNGKEHKAALIENDADALYAKPLDDAGKPVNAGPPTRPVFLLIDLNDDGKFETRGQPGEVFDARLPFAVEGKNYLATVAPDGSGVKIAPTDRKLVDLAPKRPPLLAAGTTAPDFIADAWGGGTLKLGDYKGKIVVLDFWATWCGPCQVAMPHVEKVYQAVKDQGVVVLGVCVWDERQAYEEWVPKNREKYSFTFAYDPAGRDSDKGIAKKLYSVSGIPTTYIIDRDGNVSASVVGYSPGSTAIEDALRKLGVKVPALAEARP